MFKRRPSFLGKRTSLFGSSSNNAATPPPPSPAAPPTPSTSSTAPTTVSSLASSSQTASRPSLAEPAVSPLVAAARKEEEEGRAQPSRHSPYGLFLTEEDGPSRPSSTFSRSHTAPNPASRCSSSSSLSSTLSAIERSFGEPASRAGGGGEEGGRRPSEWDDAEEGEVSTPLVEGGGRRMQKDAEEAFRRLAVGGQDDGKKGKEALLVDLDADLEDEDTLASLKPTPPSPSLQRALSPPTEAPVSLPLPSPPTQEPSSHSNLASHFLASSPAPISPSPNPTNSLPAEERIHHHHHHHHHHSHHAHSPPHAAPPPLRAATISATTDLSKIPSVAINNSSGATSPKDEKKKKGGFMGLVRSSSKNAEAKAAAGRALQARDENLSPEQRVERAKHAERAYLLQTCMELGVEIHDVPPDGHCLYRAVADQLFSLKLIKEEENNPETTRLAAATYMRNNVDAFLPFLTCPPPGPEEVLGPNGEDPGEDDGMMTLVGYERYCKRVESSGEWGGEPEILALSRYYKIPIHVVQSNHPKIVAHSPDPKAKSTLEPRQAKKIRACRISYHRRLYGLGEHYNSLRKITYNMGGFAAMVPM